MVLNPKYPPNNNLQPKSEASDREQIHFNKREHSFKCKEKELPLGPKTYIMGVLNVTPDSFYDGGRYLNMDDALRRIDKMMNEGADIIDIGGESTRPGSLGVTEEEELKRVVPVIKEARKRFDLILSIDTTKSRVAEEAIGEGASIINDISGLKFNPEIGNIASKFGAGLVLTHTSSRPYDMQRNTDYNSIISDIIGSLKESVEIAESVGVDSKSIIVDPGFGFGKTLEQNLILLKYLSEFQVLGKPILIGTSRKSFIGEVLGVPLEERLEGTAATVVIGIMNGASIVRVHDVFYIKRVVNIADAVLYASYN
jgi:dihydropteroate synthase